MELEKYAQRFDQAAQSKANTFWFYAVVAGIMAYSGLGWWTLIPGLIAVLFVIQSVQASSIAHQLREGKIPPRLERMIRHEEIINQIGEHDS